MEISQNNHKSQNRKEIIEEVLSDLELLKIDPSLNQYAINENIAFFEATKSMPKYIWWLLTKAPKIDGEKLLEINDLLPKWDLAMHRKLIEIEKRDFPGLVKPLVNKVVEFILKENRRLVAMNLGCGGMEIERQVIKRLIELKYNQKIIFIGVDKSPVTHEVAKENLREIESDINIHEIENLDKRTLDIIINSEKHTHVLIMCKNDIFQLDKFFRNKQFDLIYHSFFKHHLPSGQQVRLSEVINSISNRTFEYDGYRSWIHLIPQTITAWEYPQFLNASVFSNFRYPKKVELKLREEIGALRIYKIGTYLLEL